MSFTKDSVKLYRHLLCVLRNVTRNTSLNQAYKQCYGYKYVCVLYQNRRNASNKEVEELYYFGNTYLCLLKSVKDGKVLQKRYKGSGEQSVSSIAERVGFKLPNIPSTVNE